MGLQDSAFSKGLDNSRNKLNQWGESFRNIGTKLTAGVTAPLAAVGFQMIKSASSLDQALGKTDAVFQRSADSIKAWSTTTSDAIGVSQTQALQWTGTIGNFFTSAGMAHDISAQMSQDFVTLAADMGAFNDVSAARSSEALISGLAGEYDSLQRLGVNITAAKVDQEAFNIATAAGRDTVTEADLALARYNVIMRESAVQQGQFKREADGAAGATARLLAKASDLSARFGRHLLPVATDVVNQLIRLADWIDSLSPSTQKWAIVVAALAAALGPVLIAIGMMLPGLGALLGLFAAMVSPIGLLVAAAGLLAFAFRDEIGAALDWLTGRIQFAINVFQNLRAIGMDPVQAGLQTLATVFPVLESVITPVRTAILNLVEAFNELRAGNYAAAFAAIGEAAGAVGSAIWEAITSINWEGIRSALWNGIQGAVSWIGNRALEIPSITVDVAKWVAGKIADVWDFLTGHVFGGNKGDGTGGATDPGFGGVTIASAALSVLSWVKGQIADAWESLKGWVISPTGGVLILTGIVMNITNWGNPVWQVEPTTAIAETIGDAVVPLAQVAIAIANWTIDADWESLKTIVRAGAIAVLVGIAAISVAVPLTLIAGAIAGGLLGAALAYFLAVWALNNPGEAVDLMIELQLLLDKITNNLPSASEIIEDILNFIIPGGGSLIVKVPVVLDLITGGDEGSEGDGSISEGSKKAGSKAFEEVWKSPEGNKYGGGSAKQFMGNNRGGGLAALGRQIADGLDNIKNNVIQPKVAEWGTTFQTGVAPLGPIAAAAFNAIPAVATPAMVATGAVVGTQTSFMNTSASTNWAMMLGSAVLNFTNTRLTGTSNTSLLGTTVASTLSTMATNAGSSFGTMASRGISETTRMRIGTIAESAMAAGGIASELISGGARAVSGFGGQIGRLAGVVTSSGSSAIGAASSLGTNVGSALAGALDAMYGPVSAAASRLAGAAAEAMALALQVSSPSRWAIWLIEMLGKGLLIGFDRIARPVIGSAGGVGDAITKALNPSATLPDIDLPGRSADHNNGERPFVQIVTLEPGKWKEFLQKAENGDTFARNFGPELAMQMGVS